MYRKRNQVGVAENPACIGRGRPFLPLLSRRYSTDRRKGGRRRFRGRFRRLPSSSGVLLGAGGEGELGIDRRAILTSLGCIDLSVV